MKSGDERRLESRVGRCETIFIELMSASRDDSSPAKIVICNTVDISANGLQVTLDNEVEVGAVLQLGLDLKDPKQRIHMVGEIMWCRPVPEAVGKGYYLGFELYESDGTDIEVWKELVIELFDDPSSTLA